MLCEDSQTWRGTLENKVVNHLVEAIELGLLVSDGPWME